ncbi:hypothetical protein CEXT_774911, partial [Caerostris extrusa]
MIPRRSRGGIEGGGGLHPEIESEDPSAHQTVTWDAEVLAALD